MVQLGRARTLFFNATTADLLLEGVQAQEIAEETGTKNQEDALEAWRTNFNEHRSLSMIAVTLARSYVLGGSTISSDHAYLQAFVAAFAAHPKNRLA